MSNVGQGKNASVPPALGLRGLLERVHALGGDLTLPSYAQAELRAHGIPVMLIIR